MTTGQGVLNAVVNTGMTADQTAKPHAGAAITGHESLDAGAVRPDDAYASVAGEEDPGAALDVQGSASVGTGKSMTKSARITGDVEYREGDGANIRIRLGPCEVDETTLDATISWTDGESHGSAAIPIADFRRYIASKAIQIDGMSRN